LVEVANPNTPITRELLDQTKNILEKLYKIRGLEAQELAQSLEQHGVRRITPADMEYWTASDSPLF
jgi:predicted transcriptional regulator